MRHTLGLFVLSLLAGTARSQTFEHYTNVVLRKVPEARSVKELKKLTSDLITDHDRVIPKTHGAVIVVKTNEGRWAKLLVQSARQKVGEDRLIPILYIEKFVTYKEGEEQTILASGQRLSLFPGFRLSLDIGQVVPAELAADLRFVVEKDRGWIEPVGKAKLYLLTQPLPEATPKKGQKVVVGDTFDIAYFNGTYKLHDDGRRSGTLKLSVDREGTVSGVYYSDRDGAKYEVKGKVGPVQHAIQFSIRFPRTEQTYQGYLFTGDARAITGTSKLAQQEKGFYAVRVEE